MADGLQNIGNILAGFGAGVQGQGAEFLQGLDKRRATQAKLSEERKIALVQDVAVGLDHLENDRPDMAAKLFSERVNSIRQLGGDPTESLGTLEDIINGKTDKVKKNLKGVVRAAQIRGILPETPTSKFLEIDKERGLAFFSTPDGVVSQAIAGIEGGIQAPEEIRKETRGEVRKQVDSIRKESNVIRVNWEKLNNLAGEIKKGNRQAVPQALVAIVKLGDPGSIVSTNEMRGAINAEDPVSAMFNLISSRGGDADLAQSIASKIDPLNPENISVDNLLATGKATVSAFIPTLQARLASSEEQAASTLTPAGITSIFSDKFRAGVAGLSELLPQQKALSNDLTPSEQAELDQLEAIEAGQ